MLPSEIFHEHTIPRTALRCTIKSVRRPWKVTHNGLPYDNCSSFFPKYARRTFPRQTNTVKCSAQEVSRQSTRQKSIVYGSLKEPSQPESEKFSDRNVFKLSPISSRHCWSTPDEIVVIETTMFLEKFKTMKSSNTLLEHWFPSQQESII